MTFIDTCPSQDAPDQPYLSTGDLAGGLEEPVIANIGFFVSRGGQEAL